MREYFDKELTQLNDSLIEMGGLVEQAIKNTMKMIVDGECDELPEQAFYMVGTIDEAVEKARKIKEEEG